MSVAALTAAMVLVTAVPAFATIHELARVPADNPGGDDRSPIAGEYPPGLTDAEGTKPPIPEEVDGFENGSQNSEKLNSEGPNPLGCNITLPEGGSCEGNFAQAIVSVGQNPSGSEELPNDPAPKDLGASNAFESSSPSNN